MKSKQKKLNIRFIAKGVEPKTKGGSHRSLHLLAKNLGERGHDVSVETFETEGTELEPERYKITNHTRDHTTKVELSHHVYKKLHELENQTDIYHIFPPRYIQFGGLYKKKGGETPIIGRLNSYFFCTNYAKMDGQCQKNCTYKKKYTHADRNKIEKFALSPIYLSDTHVAHHLLNNADQLFAQSPDVKQIYEDIGISKEKITVVPNFYDSNLNNDNGEEYSGSKNWKVLFVGRLIHRKGVDILIKSIRDMDDDVDVEIVGDGPMLEELKELTRKYGLEDEVTFHGWVNYSNLSSIYSTSNIFVHPGRWPDPLPRTVFEAMSHGCVPIVSNIGGPPWMVQDSGIVFQMDCESSLSESITYLINNQDKYEKLRNNLEKRLDDFQPNIVLDRVESNYYDVL